MQPLPTPTKVSTVGLVAGISFLAECREELQRQRTRIRERLREQLWSAACLRDYQLACVQRAYESEVEQIEREFETEKAQLKERVLADLLEHRRRLTEGRLEAREENAQLPGASRIKADLLMVWDQRRMRQ